MAELSQIEKINLSLKMAFGIQGLSNTDDSAGLKWYEEKIAYESFLLNNEIFMDNVPTAANSIAADVNVTANASILEKRDIKLTVVNGSNGRAWASYKTYNDPSSGVWDDWLTPQIFGQGYSMRLYRDNGSGTAVGTEITTTEGAWIPVYKLGYVILGAANTATVMGWQQPLWASVYRYKGAKGVSGSTSGVSLDDAYNNGDTITVDAGAVVLTASNDYAPLQITPIAYTPSAGLAAGQVCIRDGIQYSYDATRSKWLSVDQPILQFKIRVGDANYLFTGDHSTTSAGFITPRDCTIIAMTANGSGNLTKTFKIRKNKTDTDISSFSLTAGSYSSASIDLDFSAGDLIQVYCDAGGAFVNSPSVNLFIAWKI